MCACESDVVCERIFSYYCCAESSNFCLQKHKLCPRSHPAALSSTGRRVETPCTTAVVSRCVETLSCSVESHLSWAPQRSRADPARCCRSAWRSFRKSDRRRPSPPPSTPTSLYGRDSGLYERSTSIFTIKAFSAHWQPAGVHAHLRATSPPPRRCTAPPGSAARCR